MNKIRIQSAPRNQDPVLYQKVNRPGPNSKVRRTIWNALPPTSVLHISKESESHPPSFPVRNSSQLISSKHNESILGLALKPAPCSIPQSVLRSSQTMAEQRRRQEDSKHLIPSRKENVTYALATTNNDILLGPKVRYPLEKYKNYKRVPILKATKRKARTRSKLVLSRTANADQKLKEETLDILQPQYQGEPLKVSGTSPATLSLYKGTVIPNEKVYNIKNVSSIQKSKLSPSRSSIPKPHSFYVQSKKKVGKLQDVRDSYLSKNLEKNVSQYSLTSHPRSEVDISLSGISEPTEYNGYLRREYQRVNDIANPMLGNIKIIQPAISNKQQISPSARYIPISVGSENITSQKDKRFNKATTTPSPFGEPKYVHSSQSNIARKRNILSQIDRRSAFAPARDVIQSKQPGIFYVSRLSKMGQSGAAHSKERFRRAKIGPLAVGFSYACDDDHQGNPYTFMRDMYDIETKSIEARKEKLVSANRASASTDSIDEFHKNGDEIDTHFSNENLNEPDSDKNTPIVIDLNLNFESNESSECSAPREANASSSRPTACKCRHSCRPPLHCHKHIKSKAPCCGKCFRRPNETSCCRGLTLKCIQAANKAMFQACRKHPRCLNERFTCFPAHKKQPERTERDDKSAQNDKDNPDAPCSDSKIDYKQSKRRTSLSNKTLAPSSGDNLSELYGNKSLKFPADYTATGLPSSNYLLSENLERERFGDFRSGLRMPSALVKSIPTTSSYLLPEQQRKRQFSEFRKSMRIPSDYLTSIPTSSNYLLTRNYENEKYGDLRQGLKLSSDYMTSIPSSSNYLFHEGHKKGQFGSRGMHVPSSYLSCAKSDSEIIVYSSLKENDTFDVYSSLKENDTFEEVRAIKSPPKVKSDKKREINVGKTTRHPSLTQKRLLGQHRRRNIDVQTSISDVSPHFRSENDEEDRHKNIKDTIIIPRQRASAPAKILKSESFVNHYTSTSHIKRDKSTQTFSNKNIQFNDLIVENEALKEYKKHVNNSSQFRLISKDEILKALFSSKSPHVRGEGTNNINMKQAPSSCMIIGGSGHIDLCDEDSKKIALLIKPMQSQGEAHSFQPMASIQPEDIILSLTPNTLGKVAVASRSEMMSTQIKPTIPLFIEKAKKTEASSLKRTTTSERRSNKSTANFPSNTGKASGAEEVSIPRRKTTAKKPSLSEKESAAGTVPRSLKKSIRIKTNMPAFSEEFEQEELNAEDQIIPRLSSSNLQSKSRQSFDSRIRQLQTQEMKNLDENRTASSIESLTSKPKKKERDDFEPNDASFMDTQNPQLSKTLDDTSRALISKADLYPESGLNSGGKLDRQLSRMYVSCKTKTWPQPPKQIGKRRPSLQQCQTSQSEIAFPTSPNSPFCMHLQNCGSNFYSFLPKVKIRLFPEMSTNLPVPSCASQVLKTLFGQLTTAKNWPFFRPAPNSQYCYQQYPRQQYTKVISAKNICPFFNRLPKIVTSNLSAGRRDKRPLLGPRRKSNPLVFI